MTWCPHNEALKHIPQTEDIIHFTKTKVHCDSCSACGPNLWLCLDSSCMYVGCGEAASDHSAEHAARTHHCLILNLTSTKIWCDACESEVTMHSTSNIVRGATSSTGKSMKHSLARAVQLEDSDIEDDLDDSQRPRGLTGLRNIGNTCYMNAALQALSNCQPLTQFFLKCPGYIALVRSPSLAKNYMKLMADIWHKQRSSYVTPNAVLNSVKLVHPMFRGYFQQDSQEFLRCFMDHLHEELKQPVVEVNVSSNHNADDNDDTESERSSIVDEHLTVFAHRRVPSTVSCDAAEVSDNDYETCDSGLSSENVSEATESVSSVIEVGDRSVVCNGHSFVAAATGSVSSSRFLERDYLSDAVRIHDGMAECRSTTDSSVNVVGDVVGDGSGIIKTDSSKCESGGGESAAAVTITNSISLTFTAMSSSGIKTNMSMPSLDSAIVDDGSSGLSSVNDPEAYHGSESSSLLPPKWDSARSTKSSVSSKKLSPRPREGSESESSGRVRRTSEAAALQTAAKQKKPVQFTSIISAIFDGKILSSVQCLTCLRVSSTNETFQDLSLPIPGKDQLQFIRASSAQGPIDADGPLLQSSAGQRGSCADSASKLRWMSSVVKWPFNMACWMFSWFWGPVITLQDCLAAFFSADDLKGDNMYSCEKCKKLRNGVKYSRVLKLPEILCVHLKRFRHEFTFSSKISNYVLFPLEGLDMRPYLHKDCKDEVTVYDLVAVICHHGTAGGGHYTAYALNYINLSWYEYDDQSVTEVDSQQVENCEAYVLFYRKKNEQMEHVREKASELGSCLEDSLMTFYISQQWISKFNTFAEPGPIDNYDFLCRHGDFHPNAVSLASLSDLVMPISQSLWEYLYGRFGGGPAVNRLSVCQPCLLETERLAKRQLHEKEEFLRLNSDFQERSPSCAVYALSMVWFREWENFVSTKTKDPPGPIDNTKICQVKNGATSLLVNSDYAQISDGMWVMLKTWYGGGPEVLIRPAAVTVATSSSSSSRLDEGNDAVTGGGRLDIPTEK